MFDGRSIERSCFTVHRMSYVSRQRVTCLHLISAITLRPLWEQPVLQDRFLPLASQPMHKMPTTGRPRVEWTSSRKRKLVRLYLCTDMRLENIVVVLRDGEFRPNVLHSSFPCATPSLTYLEDTPDTSPTERTVAAKVQCSTSCRKIYNEESCHRDEGMPSHQAPSSFAI
jgi:hypothetical protein